MVRGTEGPTGASADLTHVRKPPHHRRGPVSRQCRHAGRLGRQCQHIKPGARMPSYGSFTGEDLRALAGYLESLK